VALWIAANVAFSVLTTFLVAIGFAALATWLVEQVGRWTLGPLWLFASVATASLLLLRVQNGQVVSGLADAYGVPFPLFWLFLGLWAAGFGAVSLYVWQRARAGAMGFSIQVARRSAGRFFTGFLLFCAGVAIKDFMELF